MTGHDIISLVADKQDRGQFREKTWQGNFENYLDKVIKDPRLARNAFQRLYDMVMSYGLEEYERFRTEPAVHLRFFEDPNNGGRDAIYGLDTTLEAFVNAMKSAAHGYGIEKRVLLLHGPVGSSKSTIARLCRRVRR